VPSDVFVKEINAIPSWERGNFGLRAPLPRAGAGILEEEKVDVQLNPSGSRRPRGSRVDSPDEVP
jgi:hypothetical protein